MVAHRKVGALGATALLAIGQLLPQSTSAATYAEFNMAHEVDRSSAALAEQRRASSSPRDSAEAARGRKILSTAFVRVPAGGVLHVTLRNGRAVTLRDVMMNASDYCGTRVDAAAPGKRFCGSYPDVVDATALLSAPAS